MRHGEAEIGHGISDVDRELTTHGKREIEKAGKWFLQHFPIPELFLVSPILRAQQTFQEFTKYFPQKVNQLDCYSLVYTQSPKEFLVELPVYDNQTIFCIGHQPLIGEYLYLLTRQPLKKDIRPGSIHALQYHKEINSHFLWSTWTQEIDSK